MNPTAEQIRPSLISVSEATPPIVSPVDAAVDLEILKATKQFAVTDEGSANWLVRRVVAAREYGEKVKVWAEQERRRAEREEHTLMFLFGRQIESWARGEIDKLGGRRKSIALPGGTVAFRTVNAALRVDNEDEVLAWARRHCPAAVETVTLTKLSRGVLSDHFKVTGEVPACGAHVESEKEVFSIR